MKTVDIIVPAFNEEESLPLFYYTVNGVLENIKNFRFSYIFIDDGSKDGTLSLLKEMAQKDKAVKYISFSRNFGKEGAIYAGLSNSTADFVILMDSDLQHPPTLIPDMLNAVTEEGYEACGAKRKSGAFSRMFANVNNKLTTVQLEKGATDYMCMSRQFVEAVLQLSETQRFSKGLFAWVGFKVKWLDYVQNEREAGKSKWNIRKLFAYAMDGLTGFSVVPLKIVTYVGAIICFLAVVYIIITLIKTWVNGIDVPGYVTLLSGMLFLGGIILLSIGVLGDYIGRIYMETKNRPMYIASQTNIRNEKLMLAEIRATNLNNKQRNSERKQEKSQIKSELKQQLGTPFAKIGLKPMEKPQAKAGQKQAEKPQVKAEQKQNEKPQARIEQKQAEKPQARTEQKQTEKTQAKAEQKQAEKPQVKTEQKQNEKPQARTEQKQAEKTQVKAERKQNEKLPVKAEQKPIENPQVKAETKPNKAEEQQSEITVINAAASENAEKKLMEKAAVPNDNVQKQVENTENTESTETIARDDSLEGVNSELKERVPYNNYRRKKAYYRPGNGGRKNHINKPAENSDNHQSN